MTDKEVITKALEFLDKEYDTYPSAEEWRQALRDILNKVDIQPQREKFYAKEFNMERADANLEALIKNCTLKEIFWIMSNIMYDQVAYYSKEHHAPIYDDNSDKLNVEQANRFQQQLSTILDLYGQSLFGRVFDENYLKNYEFAGPYLKILREKNERIEQLEEAIKELNSKV